MQYLFSCVAHRREVAAEGKDAHMRESRDQVEREWTCCLGCLRGLGLNLFV